MLGAHTAEAGKPEASGDSPLGQPRKSRETWGGAAAGCGSARAFHKGARARGILQCKVSLEICRRQRREESLVSVRDLRAEFKSP